MLVKTEKGDSLNCSLAVQIYFKETGGVKLLGSNALVNGGGVSQSQASACLIES